MAVELKPLSATDAAGEPLPRRLSMCLWGTAGCGKTHLANSIPGPRILLNFDPDGPTSLGADENTLLLDYSTQLNAAVDGAKSQVNPFDLDTLLNKHPHVQSVVVDSMTAFGTMAVQHAITKAPGATFENPGPGAYGLRNRLVLGLAKNILFVTGRYNKHVVFICHEDVPVKDKEGNAISITLLLGGSLVEEVPLQISEVWHMRDTQIERLCIVRQVGLRKPMKTRMFDTTNGFEFVTSSNKLGPSKDVRLDVLFDTWKANRYNKIAIPK